MNATPTKSSTSHLEHITPTKARTFLHEKFVGPLVGHGSRSREVVWVEPSTSIKDMLAIMSRETISDLPIGKKDPERSGHVTFFGICTMFDVALFIGEAATLEKSGDQRRAEVMEAVLTNSTAQMVLENVEELKSAQTAPTKRTGSKCLNIFEATDRLDYALGAIAQNRSSHALVRGKGWMHVLSPSDIVQYLSQQINKIDPTLAGVRAADIIRSPFSVNKSFLPLDQESTALGALRHITTVNHYQAVPILSRASKRLLGTFSVSDVSPCDTPEAIASLRLPVLKYLDSVKGGTHSPVTCGPASTIEAILSLMDKEKVEQVWVVNDEQATVGAVTLADILHFAGF